MQVRLKQIIPAVFWPVHRAISAGTVQEVVAKGGRGSGKSSYVSLELVYRLLRTPDCHAVVLRKVAGSRSLTSSTARRRCAMSSKACCAAGDTA